MNPVIRNGIRRDREQLLAIVAAQDNFLPCEKDIAVEVIDASFDPAQGYHLLVADHGQAENDSAIAGHTSGEIAGFIVFGPIPLTDNRYDLYWIAVEPHRGRAGIGSLLLTQMEGFLAERGGGHIYVDTSSIPGYRRARMFYEKHYYTPVTRLENFYRDGDDRIIYRKILGHEEPWKVV